MKIELEPSHEIINTKHKKGRPYEYPFDALKEVGQSFFVPIELKKYSQVYMAVNNRNKNERDTVFVISKGERDGQEGYRVQRVK